MKAIRIYLNPIGNTFIDMGVGDNFDMGGWWNAMQTDGAALAVGGCVPVASIHRVMVVEIATPTMNLTVFPGGKPN